MGSPHTSLPRRPSEVVRDSLRAFLFAFVSWLSIASDGPLGNIFLNEFGGGNLIFGLGLVCYWGFTPLRAKGSLTKVKVSSEWRCF